MLTREIPNFDKKKRRKHKFIYNFFTQFFDKYHCNV